MASKPRKRSESDFYHVYQRGVNHFDIFEDDADRECFILKLQRYSLECKTEIHAWCLMTNHVHMLVRGELGAVTAFMRKLGSVYARYFNRRHGRSGPLFEGRFCSVCVETEPQLLSVVRYIHRNPVYHERTALWGSYPWSSYGEYAAASPATCKLDFVLNLFGGIAEMARFHLEEHDGERHLDIDTEGPMLDEEARDRANRALKKAGFEIGVARIGTLPRALRNRAIACLKSAVGCSMRQIQRLTAIAYSAIRTAIEEVNRESLQPGGLETCIIRNQSPNQPPAGKALGKTAVLRPTPLLDTQYAQMKPVCLKEPSAFSY